MSESPNYAWEIPLVNEGEAGANFKRHNEVGKRFRQVLQQTPNIKSPLSSKVEIVGIAHGKYDKDHQDYATVLVLRFYFNTQSPSKHRFRWARLIMRFEDVKSEEGYPSGPEPIRTAPARVKYFDHVTSSLERNVEGQATIGTPSNLPVQVQASLKLGWKETTPVDYSTQITCVTRNEKEVGDEDDTVMWVLEENTAPKRKKGIPTYMQTAILLRRRRDVSFKASLEVECHTDSSTLWWGNKVIEDIEDVQIDPGINQVFNPTFSFTDRTATNEDMGNTKTTDPKKDMGLAGLTEKSRDMRTGGATETKTASEKAVEKKSAVNTKPAFEKDNLGLLDLQRYFSLEL
jgi:hypothetical protein